MIKLVLVVVLSFYAAVAAASNADVEEVKARFEAGLVQNNIPRGVALSRGAGVVIRSQTGAEIVGWAQLFPAGDAPVIPSYEDALVILAQEAAEKAAKEQAAKPIEQQVAENAFFTLTETILAAVEDERAGQTPPVKLSFSEINGLIKTIQGTDPMAAINFSLELLAVDAELKRFDVLWWDKAATHIVQE